jgi:hypothetical protein
MCPEICLRESDGHGRVGWEIQFGVSFAPVSNTMSIVYGGGGVIYFTTAILTGAVVLAW